MAVLFKEVLGGSNVASPDTGARTKVLPQSEPSTQFFAQELYSGPIAIVPGMNKRELVAAQVLDGGDIRPKKNDPWDSRNPHMMWKNSEVFQSYMRAHASYQTLLSQRKTH